MKQWMKAALVLGSSIPLAGVTTGCHSAFIQATVTNTTDAPVRLFEVDYPNASFGSQDLRPGATFRYRFKVLGDGATKLTWTDAGEREHTSAGPALYEGEEGSLAITIRQASADWSTKLKSQK